MGVFVRSVKDLGFKRIVLFLDEVKTDTFKARIFDASHESIE